MKTIIKKITYLAVCLIGLNSCDDYLTTKPHDFLAPETFYTNLSNCEMALSGVYSTLSREQFYGNHYILELVVGNDLCYFQRKLSTTNTKVCSNTHTFSNSTIFGTWTALYSGINNANMFIENIDKSELDNDTKNRMKGEAKFLRAYYHWILVQGWHEVPLRKTSFKDVNASSMEATSHTEALEWIIDEMEECVTMVDSTMYTSSPSYVKKNTVMGILARVYLWKAGCPGKGGKEDYKKAAYWANEVIQSGQHKLNPDYEDIWKKMASDQYDPIYNESIWEAEFYGTRTDGNETMGRLGNVIGNVNKGQQYGYGYAAPTLILYDLYPEGDIRRDVSICTYRIEDNEGTKYDLSRYIPRCNCGKFRREWEDLHGYTADKNYTGLNWPILRYSDVLLMFAEAENEVNGASAAAFEAINTVRKRAGIPTLSGLDQDGLRQEIRDERARELCFEALRKFDLVRWGTYVDALTKDLAKSMEDRTRWGNGLDFNETPEALTINTTEKHQYWPIPETELSVNGLLDQNTYWK